MKQSTKLLSLVLALVMAFSCMTVIGNAALVKSEITWDNIDDAQLTAEQVADLALDLVDNDLLAGIEPMDLSILGELNLSSVDKLFTSISDLRNQTFVWGLADGLNLLGDITKLDFDPFLKSGRWGGILSSKPVPHQRTDNEGKNDLRMVYQVLEFIGCENNADRLSKVAYGLGGDPGISLGIISNFLDLGEVGEMLNNIPAMLTGLVYDLLVHGSFLKDSQKTYKYSSKDSYPSLDDLKENGDALPSGMDTLDGIVNNVILNLVINPQNFEYVGEGDAAVKEWEMDSCILPTLKAKVESEGRESVIADATVLENSLFDIIDYVAQIAIDDLGVNALNHNLKKALMEAVEAELNEVDYDTLPQTVKDIFDAEENYVTYIGYDCMAKDGNDWYYTTLETDVKKDPVTQEPITDEAGNEITERVRKYFKFNTAAANEFYGLINWDWTFYRSDDTEAELDEFNCIIYDDLIAEYGSIIGSLNHLIYLVYNVALNEEVRNDFEEKTAETWVDGGNEKLNDNVTRIVKYLLVEFGDRIFGQDSAYANMTWEEIKAYDDIIDIVALIGPEFFEDAMPQIIIPKDSNGKYAFHDGVQFLEFGALVIREFITEIAPNVNYDAHIFAEGTVTSANDRQFKVQSAENWFNIILNMGVDIGATYLLQLTNFEYYLHNHTSLGANFDLEAYVTAGGGSSEGHWKTILDYAILWATWYVSNEKTSGVLNKLDYNTVLALGDPATVPFERLSYILNTILPLGFVNGCASDAYAFDVSLLYERVQDLLTNFNLNALLGLFGRADNKHNNILMDKPLVQSVLELVNGILSLVFRANILQDTDKLSLDAVVDQESLKVTVKTLLMQLNNIKAPLLLNALPIVGKFIKGWGTEQEFKTPEITLSRSYDLKNGATSAAETIQVRNASEGVWRHFKDASGNVTKDNQYKIKLKNVKVYDELGDVESKYVTVSFTENQEADYGQSIPFTFTATGVPATGALVRFEVGYQVIDEDNNIMSNEKIFYAKSYAWLNYNPTDARSSVENNSKLIFTRIFTPQYIPLSTALETIENAVTSDMHHKSQWTSRSQTGKITNNSGTVDGLTFGSYSYKFGNTDEHYIRDVKNFQTYNAPLTDEDSKEVGKTVSIKGSINKSEWESKNKTSGSRTDFSMTLTDKDGDEPATFSLIYYDDVNLNKLKNIASNEMGAMRLTADYNLTGVTYADRVLETQNSKDDEGETVFRETNATDDDVAWIATADSGKWAGSYTAANGSTITKTVTEYDESAVTVTDAENFIGEVTVNGEKITVKKVTKIDCATAVGKYVAALIPGVRGAMQSFRDDGYTLYNFAELYEALYVAANDIGYCKKDAKQVVEEGNGDNIGAAVDTLKANLKTIETANSKTKDYTDYKMYRWNRFNDARNDAKYYINLKNDASNATVDEIDATFPYTWIEEDDLRALVAGDKYEAYILALLEQMDEEEIKAKAEWLEAKKLEYQTQTLLDVQMAENLVKRTANRLIPRKHGIQTKYLADEITSADNMVKAESNYTARSWAKYIEAYNEAKSVLANPTQMTVFDAKYNLMVSRNELVLKDFEADYTELETLIAQAQQVLANRNLYANSDKEIGQVLAELGYKDFTNADGDAVQLFPGSAIYENAEPYAEDEQYKIDRAATALKEALARLKFKNVSITGANITTETIVPGDEEAGIEDITATVARIAPEKDADAVKILFTVAGASVDKDNIIVSNDVNYTVETEKEFAFAGTNATVTFYTLVSGVKVPVATVKIVVDADVNGDGVLDVLDGALTELVSNEHAELEGCYFLAGNLDAASEEIKAADYTAVVNKILA